MKVTVVIPNYNGMEFLDKCLSSLRDQNYNEFKTLVVDNGSTDESLTLLERKYPEVSLISLAENTGFCNAVNVGIKAADTPYVILLNNDTEVKLGFIENLICAMEQHKTPERIFAVSSKMLMLHDPQKIDDAGDEYCALGWAFAVGKGKPEEKYCKPREVFAACGGASLYRKSVFEEIGYFDENHFAYLEDIDIGYRARIFGYTNLYEPKAQVLHVGSGFSGSRYNEFKVKLSSANNAYIVWKNMPFLQWLINFPFLLFGFLIKVLFFARKKMALTYMQGYMKGIAKSFSRVGRSKKIRFKWKNLNNYAKIQLDLWKNIAKIHL